MESVQGDVSNSALQQLRYTKTVRSACVFRATYSKFKPDYVVLEAENPPHWPFKLIKTFRHWWEY
jgi:hypothetical protein